MILASEQPQFVRGKDSKRCQVFHRDAGPCWHQCFPQLCPIGWMSFGWWTILDKQGKLLSVKNPAALQYHTPTTIPCSKALKLFVLPIHPLSGTHTIQVSIVLRLKNPYFLLPFTQTDRSGFNKWHQGNNRFWLMFRRLNVHITVSALLRFGALHHSQQTWVQIVPAFLSNSLSIWLCTSGNKRLKP